MAFGKLQLRTFRDFAQGMVVYRSGRPPTRDIFETEEFSVRVVRLDVSEFFHISLPWLQQPLRLLGNIIIQKGTFPRAVSSWKLLASWTTLLTAM